MKRVRQNQLRAAALCALGLGAFGTAEAAIQVRADFNKDGFEDLAIGVPSEGVPANNEPNPPNAAAGGAAQVIYGTATGLSATGGPGNQFWFQTLRGITRELSEPGDNFGYALAAGDFNNDGFADLAIGALTEDLSVNGFNVANAVHILYGSANGLTDANDQAFTQTDLGLGIFSATDAFFGGSLAAGDFDQDGFADLAIGVFGFSLPGLQSMGAVNVVRGSATGLTTQGAQFVNKTQFSLGSVEPFDQFGATLAAGDFNNDGAADLAIGVPFDDFFNGAAPFQLVTNAGTVDVVYGSATGLKVFSGVQEWSQGPLSLQGRAVNQDRFGLALAAGDFNADGRDDLAVGVPGDNASPPSDLVLSHGAVNVVYGSATGLTSTGNQFWHQDLPGIIGLASLDEFGTALTVGDFNGDSFVDLAVGVPQESSDVVTNNVAFHGGAVNVLYGGAPGLTDNGDQLWHLNVSFIKGIAKQDDFFGSTLAAGDFNGDSKDDLVVGTPSKDRGDPGASNFLPGTGTINVIYGSADRLTSTNNQEWHQDVADILDLREQGDFFGGALAGSQIIFSAGLSGEWLKLAQPCSPRCRIRGTLKVFNPGKATAERSVLRFFLSTNKKLDATDTLLKEVTVKALAPEESVKRNLKVKLAPGQNGKATTSSPCSTPPMWCPKHGKTITSSSPRVSSSGNTGGRKPPALHTTPPQGWSGAFLLNEQAGRVG